MNIPRVPLFQDCKPEREAYLGAAALFTAQLADDFLHLGQLGG